MRENSQMNDLWVVQNEIPARIGTYMIFWVWAKIAVIFQQLPALPASHPSALD